MCETMIVCAFFQPQSGAFQQGLMFAGGDLLSVRTIARPGMRFLICLWRVFNQASGQVLKFFKRDRRNAARFLLL
jgi:hypothetical protein